MAGLRVSLDDALINSDNAAAFGPDADSYQVSSRLSHEFNQRLKDASQQDKELSAENQAQEKRAALNDHSQLKAAGQPQQITAEVQQKAVPAASGDIRQSTGALGCIGGLTVAQAQEYNRQRANSSEFKDVDKEVDEAQGAYDTALQRYNNLFKNLPYVRGKFVVLPEQDEANLTKKIHQQEEFLHNRITATKRDLDKALAKRQLRDDLASGSAPLPTEQAWRSYSEVFIQKLAETPGNVVKFGGIVGGYAFSAAGANGIDSQNNALYRNGASLNAWVDEKIPADPSRQHETAMQMAGGAGFLTSMAIPGSLGSKAGTAISLTTGAANSSVPAYDAASDAMNKAEAWKQQHPGQALTPNMMDVTANDRLKAFALNAGLSYLPFKSATSLTEAAAGKSLLETLGSAAQTGARNAVAMSGYTVADNAIAQTYYNQNRRLSDGIGENAALGFAFGMASAAPQVLESGGKAVSDFTNAYGPKAAETMQHFAQSEIGTAKLPGGEGSLEERVNQAREGRATHKQLVTTVQTNFANERSKRIDDIIGGNEFKALNIDENSTALVKDAVTAASNEAIKHKDIEGFTAHLTEKLDAIGLSRSVNLADLFKRIPEFNFQRSLGSVSHVRAERKVALKEAFDSFQTIGSIDPQVLTTDIDAPHPMNIGSYLHNRLPDNMLDMARRDLPKSMVAMLKSGSNNRLEFFVGNKSDMLDYYTGVKGLDHVGEFNSPTSTEFNLFARPKNDNEFIVVASGMASNARIAHQSYQFKFAGIDVSQVPIRGEIRRLVHADVAAFREKLAELPKGDKDAVFFIGNRKAVLNILSPGTNFKTIEKGSFKFSHILTNDGKTSYTGLRMPNGDLAYHATKAVLEAGYRDIVMVGAGGAFPHEFNGFIRKDTDVTKVGQYQVVTSAMMNGDTIDIKSLKGVIIRDIKAGGPINQKDGRNVTVNSPLEENDTWYNANSQKFSSVDVETYHILRAIRDFQDEHPEEKITLLPGLFSSDVLKDHPLDQKINPDNAYKNLGEFLNQIKLR